MSDKLILDVVVAYLNNGKKITDIARYHKCTVQNVYKFLEGRAKRVTIWEKL